MIDLGHMYSDSGESGNSALARYVLRRLPDGYMINENDLRCDDVN